MNEAFPTSELVDIPPEAWWTPSEFLDLDDFEIMPDSFISFLPSTGGMQ